MGGLMPTPAEVVDHTFGFVDRLVANLREFNTKLVALLPATVKTGPASVKASPKAQAA
jgi:hypothetical protein